MLNNPNPNALSDPSSTCTTPDSAEINLHHILRLAEDAAHRAGEIQKYHIYTQPLTVTNNLQRDIKIEVDRLCETAICDLIQEAYPQHGIVTEESGQKTSKSKLVWIIDPLDGTLNYFFGIPLFCTCVACYRLPEAMNTYPQDNGYRYLAQAEPLVGVVYAPLLDRLYSAAAGQGATCNGLSIQPVDGHRLEDAMVGISFGSDDAVIKDMEALNAQLVRRVKKVRIFGSTGLDLAHVATGHLSALIQLKVRIWDIAAALVILKESGANYDVQPGAHGGWQLLAASRRIFPSLQKIVRASKSTSANHSSSIQH